MPDILHHHGWAQATFNMLMLHAANAGNPPQPAQHKKTHDERCISPPLPLSSLLRTLLQQLRGALLHEGRLRDYEDTCSSSQLVFLS